MLDLLLVNRVVMVQGEVRGLVLIWEGILGDWEVKVIMLYKGGSGSGFVIIIIVFQKPHLI